MIFIVLSPGYRFMNDYLADQKAAQGSERAQTRRAVEEPNRAKRRAYEGSDLRHTHHAEHRDILV